MKARNLNCCYLQDKIAQLLLILSFPDDFICNVLAYHAVS